MNGVTRMRVERSCLRRTFIEHCVDLDIRCLVRDDLLIQNSKFEWVWKGRSHQSKGAITIQVFSNYLFLHYVVQTDGVKKPMLQFVMMSTTNCHGGRRSWFLCPKCIKRVNILYFKERAFQCRKCHQLVYTSQYPTKIRSYGRRHQMIPIQAS